MDGRSRWELLQELRQAADELARLGDTAELMGDEPGAERFRGEAARCRLRAMALLDD